MPWTTRHWHPHPTFTSFHIMTGKTTQPPTHPPVGEVPLLALRGASRKSGKVKQQIWKINRLIIFDILRVDILGPRDFGFVGQAVCNLQAADVVSFNCHLASSDLQSTCSFSRIVMQQHFFDVFNLEQNRNGCRSSANICNIFRNSCLGFQHLTDFWSLGWSYDVSKIVESHLISPEKGHHSALNFSQFIGKFTQGGVNQQGLLGILWPRNPDGLKLGTVGNVVLPRDLAEGFHGWSRCAATISSYIHSTKCPFGTLWIGGLPFKNLMKNMRFLNEQFRVAKMFWRKFTLKFEGFFSSKLPETEHDETCILEHLECIGSCLRFTVHNED